MTFLFYFISFFSLVIFSSVYGNELKVNFETVLDKRIVLEEEKTKAKEITEQIQATMKLLDPSLESLLPKNIVFNFIPQNNLKLPDCPESQYASDREALNSFVKKGNFGISDLVTTGFNKSKQQMTIEINSKALSDERTFDCFHKNFKDQVKGLVIRELMKVALKNKEFRGKFDLAAPILHWGKVGTQLGIIIPTLKLLSGPKDNNEEQSVKKSKSLPNMKVKSDEPTLGESKKGVTESQDDSIFYQKINSNKDYRRSPDPIEFKNFDTALAVHLEYFLTDPEYAKRMPVMNDFVNGVGMIIPNSEGEGGKDKKLKEQADLDYKVVLSNEISFLDCDYIERDIHPDNICRIDAVIATGGMANAGHTMFRLVPYSDDPEMKKKKECTTDHSKDVVMSPFSFVGQVGALAYNLKGIGFMSRFMARPFFYDYKKVVETYNHAQNRDLEFYPLKLDEKQKNDFVNYTMDLYYNYITNYHVLKNNCAVMGGNITDVIRKPEDVSVNRLFSPSPIECVDNLKKRDLLQNSYGEPLETVLKWSLRINRLKGLEKLSYDVYSKLSPLERKREMEKYLQDATTPLTVKEKIDRINTLKDIEEHLALNDKYNLTRSLQAEKKNKVISNDIKKLFDIRQFNFFNPAGTNIKGGYGLVLSKDRTVNAEEIADGVAVEKSNKNISTKEKLTQCEMIRDKLLEEAKKSTIHKESALRWEESKKNLRWLDEQLQQLQQLP